MMKPPGDITTRFLAMREINDETGCWIYQGNLNNKGYGQTRHNGKTCPLHRVAYQEYVGPIPQGWDVHHRCYVKACYHPDHLWAIPHRLNVALSETYTQLRWERLHALVETHLDLALCGLTHLTTTDFCNLWGKSCRGKNLTAYLHTLTDVYPGAFEWSLVKPGRGRRPRLFEIRMSQTLIDQLTATEEETPQVQQTVLGVPLCAVGA